MSFLNKSYFRFLQSRDGSISITFALLLVPIVSMTVASIDYGFFHKRKAELQSAVDAAALAIIPKIMSEQMSVSASFEQVRASFDAMVAQYPFKAPPTLSYKVHEDERGVDLFSSGQIDTLFMGLIGLQTIEITARASSRYFPRNMDIALVLDNSISMFGPSLYYLREQTKIFVKSLFGRKRFGNPAVQIGVVPFNDAISVASDQRFAPWIDGAWVGQAPYHNENLGNLNMNRFSIYFFLRKVWPGCLEVRPWPYDVYADTPSLAEMQPDEKWNFNPLSAARLFVPWFSPDLPDVWTIPRYPTSDLESYLHDENWQFGIVWYYILMGMTPPPEMEWSARQNNARKYYVFPRFVGRYQIGPGRGCNVRKITDLSNNAWEVEDAIDRMFVSGDRNTLQGFTWGWRLLTPAAPFTRGRDPRRNPENIKIIILVTKGPQSAVGRDVSNPNLSTYSAFGLAMHNRLRVPWYLNNNFANRVQSANRHLSRACENAKRDGIIVYTISLDGMSVPNELDLLKQCATSSENFFHVSPYYISDAFKKISAAISNIYLSR